MSNVGRLSSVFLSTRVNWGPDGLDARKRNVAALMTVWAALGHAQKDSVQVNYR